MGKVDASKIYPEASEGRLKTTDDQTKSYATDTSRLISENKTLTKEEKHRFHERILFMIDDNVGIVLIMSILIAAAMGYYGFAFGVAGASIITQILNIGAKALFFLATATAIYAIVRFIYNISRGIKKK